MKVSDFIEAITMANNVFKEKHGTDMEIFGFEFSDDSHDGDMYIEAVGEVKYETGGFGYGTTRGLKPHEGIVIHFEVEDEKITDRSVTLEDL